MQQQATQASSITPTDQQIGNVSPFLSPLRIEKLALLRTFTGHTDGVHSVALSADGQILASGSWDKTIKVWGA
jgi:WD40 repeat protein